MALAIDVIDRRDPSSKMHRQLEPKKTKVRLYQLFICVAAKDVLPALYY